MRAWVERVEGVLKLTHEQQRLYEKSVELVAIPKEIQEIDELKDEGGKILKFHNDLSKLFAEAENELSTEDDGGRDSSSALESSSDHQLFDSGDTKAAAERMTHRFIRGMELVAEYFESLEVNCKVVEEGRKKRKARDDILNIFIDTMNPFVTHEISQLTIGESACVGTQSFHTVLVLMNSMQNYREMLERVVGDHGGLLQAKYTPLETFESELALLTEYCMNTATSAHAGRSKNLYDSIKEKGDNIVKQNEEEFDNILAKWREDKSKIFANGGGAGTPSGGGGCDDDDDGERLYSTSGTNGISRSSDGHWVTSGPFTLMTFLNHFLDLVVETRQEQLKIRVLVTTADSVKEYASRILAKFQDLTAKAAALKKKGSKGKSKDAAAQADDICLELVCALTNDAEILLDEVEKIYEDNEELSALRDEDDEVENAYQDAVFAINQLGQYGVGELLRIVFDDLQDLFKDAFATPWPNVQPGASIFEVQGDLSDTIGDYLSDFGQCIKPYFLHKLHTRTATRLVTWYLNSLFRTRTKSFTSTKSLNLGPTALSRMDKEVDGAKTIMTEFFQATAFISPYDPEDELRLRMKSLYEAVEVLRYDFEGEAERAEKGLRTFGQFVEVTLVKGHASVEVESIKKFVEACLGLREDMKGKRKRVKEIVDGCFGPKGDVFKDTVKPAAREREISKILSGDEQDPIMFIFPHTTGQGLFRRIAGRVPRREKRAAAPLPDGTVTAAAGSTDTSTTSTTPVEEGGDTRDSEDADINPNVERLPGHDMGDMSSHATAEAFIGSSTASKASAETAETPMDLEECKQGHLEKYSPKKIWQRRQFVLHYTADAATNDRVALLDWRDIQTAKVKKCIHVRNIRAIGMEAPPPYVCRDDATGAYKIERQAKLVYDSSEGHKKAKGCTVFTLEITYGGQKLRQMRLKAESVQKMLDWVNCLERVRKQDAPPPPPPASLGNGADSSM
jgi:hypothetical protein